MGLHNHLHSGVIVAVSAENVNTNILYPFADVFGILGIIFTVGGNVLQTWETFGLLLDNLEAKPFLTSIPKSFFLTLFSDACLVVYGIIDDNIIVAVYAAFNSILIICIMLYIYYMR